MAEQPEGTTRFPLQDSDVDIVEEPQQPHHEGAEERLVDEFHRKLQESFHAFRADVLQGAHEVLEGVSTLRIRHAGFVKPFTHWVAEPQGVKVAEKQADDREGQDPGDTVENIAEPQKLVRPAPPQPCHPFGAISENEQEEMLSVGSDSVESLEAQPNAAGSFMLPEGQPAEIMMQNFETDCSIEHCDTTKTPTFNRAASFASSVASGGMGSRIFEPNSSRPFERSKSRILERKVLAVTLTSASGLRRADMIRDSDPYCTVKLHGNDRILSKTKVVPNSTTPYWNHEMYITDFEMSDMLEFCVMDRDIGSDDPLGVALLPIRKVAETTNGVDGALSLQGTGSISGAIISVTVVLKEGAQAERWLAKFERKHKRLTQWGEEDEDNIARERVLKYSKTREGPQLVGNLNDKLWAWKFAGGNTSRRIANCVAHPFYQIVCGFFFVADVLSLVWETQRASEIFVSQPEKLNMGIPDAQYMVVLTHVLFGVFTVDLVLRLLGRRNQILFWLMFDAFALVSYALEVAGYHMFRDRRSHSEERVWITNISKLRIARVLQFVEVTTIYPAIFIEMHTMLRSMRSTLKTTFCCMLMTICYLVFFGLLIVEGAIKHCIQYGLVEADEVLPLKTNFGTLTKSVLSLFMAISGGEDWTRIYQALSLLTWRYQLIFLFFVFYSVFAFMNVIIAVMVEQIFDSAKSDKQILVTGELKAQGVFLRNLRKIFDTVDEDQSGEISQAEMKEKMKDGQVAAYFAALGVDAKQVSQLFKLLDMDNSGTITREEFLKGCLYLRGNAKSIDIAVLLQELRGVQETLDEITDMVGPAGVSRPASRSHTPASAGRRSREPPAVRNGRPCSREPPALLNASHNHSRGQQLLPDVPATCKNHSADMDGKGLQAAFQSKSRRKPSPGSKEYTPSCVECMEVEEFEV